MKSFNQTIALGNIKFHFLRAMKRSMLGIAFAGAHSNRGNSGVERNEGRNRRVMKARIPNSWMHPKIHRKQVDPNSCRVVSESLQSITQKTTTTTGRRNCEAIRSSIKKAKYKFLVASDVENINLYGNKELKNNRKK